MNGNETPNGGLQDLRIIEGKPLYSIANNGVNKKNQAITLIFQNSYDTIEMKYAVINSVCLEQVLDRVAKKINFF